MKRHPTAEYLWIGNVRRFAAALTEIISIIERLVIRLFKFAGALYAVYKLLIHH